ncbi:hypothetical protein REPUB_Repub02eG0081500 [Reevesia pubescens]
MTAAATLFALEEHVYMEKLVEQANATRKWLSSWRKSLLLPTTRNLASRNVTSSLLLTITSSTLVVLLSAMIESKLSSICDGILKLIDTRLIPSASSVDSKVFYLKMNGDYHRYLAEFKTRAERKEAAESTLTAYKSAQDVAIAELAPTYPIRLGLALNFSIFYYEILNSPDCACNLAKQARNHTKTTLSSCNSSVTILLSGPPTYR